MPSPIFLGATAILAHQDWLNMIGNNIANINTFGFKGSRMRFGDIIGQSLVGPQIGNGVVVGGVDMNFNQGALQPTGRPLDLALSGNGFFVVNDGSKNFFTRQGAFNIDQSKFLVEQTSGHRVQDTQGNDVKVDPDAFFVKGTATTKLDLVGNLDPSTPNGVTFKTSSTVFDPDGKSHSLTLTFTRNATDDNWDLVVSTPETGVLFEQAVGGPLAGAADDTLQDITYASGAFATAADIGNVGPAAVDNIQVKFGALAAQVITVDFSGTTQSSGASNVQEGSKDGKKAVFFSHTTVTNTGELKAVKTDGSAETVTNLGIALFDNPGGLSPEGNMLFSASNTTGSIKTVRANEQGAGTINSGFLESSNVDMTTELVNLIIAQRGFSMGTRVVTTADQVLQETLNLKR